jgi:hypothetical protein
MKKRFVYLLAVAVLSLTLGLSVSAQDKMTAAGATGSTAKKAGKKGASGATASTGKKGKKAASGSTGKM